MADSSKPSAPLQSTTRKKVQTQVSAMGMQDSLTAAKLNYRAGEPSKFRNTIVNIGGTGDSHYQNREHYWRIREYARDWDRNTPFIGQAVDRACDQVLGNGLRIDPQTESEDLNTVLLQMWEEWASDPEQCDLSGRFSFDELERLALRHEWIDGDCFARFEPDTGQVSLHEGDRVTSSAAEYVSEINGRLYELVHGIAIEPETGRPDYYFFHSLKPGERQRQRRVYPSVRHEEMRRYEARRVIHVYDPKRVTQNRGITAFAPVFDRIAQLDDLEFAQLVQQQVAACIAAFIETDYQIQFGAEETDTASDNSTTVTFEEFQPGMIAQLPRGTKIQTFSPSNPTSDARELTKQIVREIGLAIGLPLELSLLVTSDTTFHGYRGVVEAYKRTAKRKQSVFGRRMRSRVYRWKVAQWIAEGRLPARMDSIYAHELRSPAWQYVDPKSDAEADVIRLENHLASPRQVWADRGLDYEKGVREIVEDRKRLIDAAKAAGGEDGWRDILGLEPLPPAPQPPQGDQPRQSEASAMLAALASRPAPVVNVTTPDVKAQIDVHVPEQSTPAPVVNVQAAEAPTPVVNVNVPEQPAPVVNLSAPEAPAPVVNVQNDVHLPEPKSQGRTLKIDRDADGNVIGGHVE